MVTCSCRRFFHRVHSWSKRLLTAALFALDRWWELKCRYLSVCIAFLKTATSRVVPSLYVSCVSRKGRVQSLSSSMVHLRVGRTQLRWLSKGSTSSFFIMQHVSSTYHFMNLGLEGANCSASSSNKSMYKLATTGGAHGCALTLLIELIEHNNHTYSTSDISA